MISYNFRQGKREDVAKFLGIALRDSERAHTGTGIWDVAIGEHAEADKSLEAVLAYACLNDINSHFYYPKFIVAETDGINGEGVGGEIVAAGCGYLYPSCSASKSFPGLSFAARTLRGISEEESIAMWEKISFLDDVFPEYDFNNTWLLESIFVATGHRKAGVAVRLIARLYEEGRKHGARECLVVCAIGNVAAYRTYEKAGFDYVGKGESTKAEKAMGYPGFHVFRKTY